MTSLEEIQSSIYLIRGHQVMLDSDLAQLYGVSTKRLNEQVRRNRTRFPADFMFQLKAGEVIALRSQFATSNRGGRRYLPYAFMEQGVAMLSSVLSSERAIQVNIAIMRAFVKIKQAILSHKRLAQKFDLLEKKVVKHDDEIQAIFEAIRRLMSPPAAPKRRIGFQP